MEKRKPKYTLDKNYFNQNNLGSFIFINTQINELPKIQKFSSQIQLIKFSRCNLLTTPSGISYYPKIVELDLSDNYIQVLSMIDFLDLIMLKTLDLSINYLRYIDCELPKTLTSHFNTNIQ